MGENQFKLRGEMRQARFGFEHSDPGLSRPNRPTLPGHFNRFHRPNFTQPIQSEQNAYSSSHREQHHQNFSEPFGGNRMLTPPPQQPSKHFQQHQNQFLPPVCVGASNMPQPGVNPNMPPGINPNMPPHQVNQNMPVTHVHLNRPPPPISTMFNPNFPPPPMQPVPHSFTPPSESGARRVLPQHDAPVVQFSPNQTRPFLQNSYPPSHQNANNVRACTAENDQLVKDESQKREDEQWVAEWTKSLVKGDKTGKKHTITVSEAQEKTRHMMVLLARLQKGKFNLESMKNEDKSIWEQKMKEVLQIKTELQTLHVDLTDDKTLSMLKKKVEKTRKKRERIRRCKAEKYERRQEELAHREEIHAKIDKSMQQVIEKQRLKKQEEDMKKEADQILGQVRKKISDANKTVQLLNGVQKLRNLRKDRLARQGILSMYEGHGDSSTKSLMFERKIQDMTELLNKQLETYKAEEDTLKVILETEQEETREKEREKALQKQLTKQRNERLAEHKMLFGNQKEPKPGDPLYPFWQYYLMAENSLEALVSIRQAWDMYLTLPNAPGSSCIPTDWVIPPEPSSETWNTAVDGQP